MRRVYLSSLAAGALALAILPTGCSEDAEAAAPEEGDAEAAAAVAVPATADEPAATYDPRLSLAPMIKRVGPAVVSIHASGRRFGAHAGGSGFILDADGTVLTNHHVVRNAKELEVHLPDGRKFEAKLIGSDAHTDLAVLELEDANELPTAELGASDALEVGDWVVAIGSPMGLEHSASVGILSGRGRGSLGLYEDSYIDFLQTDADIAPGSSGGPLFDLHGRVVGITTAVGAGSRPGFAIPNRPGEEDRPEDPQGREGHPRLARSGQRPDLRPRRRRPDRSGLPRHSGRRSRPPTRRRRAQGRRRGGRELRRPAPCDRRPRPRAHRAARSRARRLDGRADRRSRGAT